MSKQFLEEVPIAPALQPLSDEDAESLLDEDFSGTLTKEYRIKLEKQYASWVKTKKDVDVSEKEVKDSLLKDLSFLKVMGVEEYTLYRKWDEIHNRKWIDDTFNRNTTLFDTAGSTDAYVQAAKNLIWYPKKSDDYGRLRPRILCTTSEEAQKLKLNPTILWNTLRTFTHTQINNSNIGRNLYFIVDDESTIGSLGYGKILGVFALSSDFMDLTPRDEYIGWSRDIKTAKRMINHTAIGSTICPTQPLGFNYVGGKLIALLTISNVAEDAWNKQYDVPKIPSKLAGITTTSLYSSFSQYQNLSYWTKRGHSSGSIKFEPSKETLELVKRYLQKTYPRKYWEWYIATEPQGMPLKRDFKQRSLAFLYTKLKIEKEYYETNHQRGIYFCPLFENTREYLRMEITEDKLIRRFDNSVESLVTIWKDKYAGKRINALLEQDRTNLKETLFYDDLITLTWEQTKAKYLENVGR